jgi:hypothetical protein
VITYVVSGIYLHRTVTEALASGTIGAEMKFIWDDDWQVLSRIVTFRAGDETADVVVPAEDTAESAIEIPYTVLSAPGELYVGVYGTDGEDVTLTVWSAGQRILHGAEPSGVTPDPPSAVVQQILTAAQAAETLAQGVRDDADAGEFDGVGIASVERTSGDGSPGTTDTYTITFTDETTAAFTVYNGADGEGEGGGTDGATWYSDAGAPSGGTGADGDFYLDTTNYDIYKKVSGSWGTIGNIKGATGARGATGPQGETGATGHKGKRERRVRPGHRAPQALMERTGPTARPGITDQVCQTAERARTETIT